MSEQSQAARYFLTVDWCNKGRRGIFCSTTGQAFPKDGSPHTEREKYDILGPFVMILAPESELLTEQELDAFCMFRPLAEYSNEYGIAIERADTPAKEQE